MIHRKITLSSIGFLLMTASIASAGVEILAPRLSVSEEYTDNLFLTNTKTQEEFITNTAVADLNEFGSENMGLERFYGLATLASYQLIAAGRLGCLAAGR